MTTHQLCTFRLGDLLFGVEIQEVQEVLRLGGLTRVPLAPPSLVGLVNLRGQIVTAVDLRRRLGLEEIEREGDTVSSVVVLTADGLVSLVVDEIGDVLDLEEVDLDNNLDLLDDRIREVARGVFKLERELLLWLDVGRAVDLSPRPE